MPLPTDTELRIHDSPVPTQTFLGLLGSIATAPIDCTGCLSNTGLNVVPPSCDRPTPPHAAPTEIRALPPTPLPAPAAIRPLIVADPMLRASSPEIVPPSNVGRSLEATGGATLATALAAAGPGKITAAMRVLGGGSLNHASSTGTLTSARSIRIRLPRAPPGLPVSIANGNHTPLTCS